MPDGARMKRAAASYVEPREGHAEDGAHHGVGGREQHSAQDYFEQPLRQDWTDNGTIAPSLDGSTRFPSLANGDDTAIDRPGEKTEEQDSSQQNNVRRRPVREYSWKQPEALDSDAELRKKLRHYIGLEPHKDLKQHHPGSETLWWSRVRATMQEPFSEFLGVMVFTMIQQGGLAQATLGASQSTAPGGNGYGNWLTVPFW